MKYQSSNFGSKGSYNENLCKALKVEISFKLEMIFVLFVN